MNPRKPYRKFAAQQQIIEDLEKTNPRFKRVYSEYEMMSDELWDMETSDEVNLPDDFVNSIKLQTSYLEDEIADWLQNAKVTSKSP